MIAKTLNQLIADISLLAEGDVAGEADRELLRRFASEGNQAAFGALMARHGPMVYGVCLRQLGDVAAAEDAFQATFLSLVRHHRSIRSAHGVAGWLYRVAVRVCQLARRAGNRRQRHERQAASMVTLFTTPSGTPRIEIDEELQRLPAHYRDPLVLCGLEGRSQEEAASALKLPIATLRTRLARGRELLRKRLEKQGIAVTTAALTALLTPAAMAAPVPINLARTTLQLCTATAVESAAAASAAVALSNAFTRSIWWGKVQTLFAAGALALVGLATASVLIPARAPKDIDGAPQHAPQDVPQNAPIPEAAPKEKPLPPPGPVPGAVVNGLRLRLRADPPRAKMLKTAGPSLPVLLNLQLMATDRPVGLQLDRQNFSKDLVAVLVGSDGITRRYDTPINIGAKPPGTQGFLIKPQWHVIPEGQLANFAYSSLGAPHGTAEMTLPPGEYRVYFEFRRQSDAEHTAHEWSWNGVAASNEVKMQVAPAQAAPAGPKH